jgi:hypothetical protein
VAGTMFGNTAQSLTLVVAKNNGIEGRDRRFLEWLQEQLRKVSRTQGNSMAIVKCDESNMLCQPDAMLGVEMRSGTISCSTAMRESVSGLPNSAPMLRFLRKPTPGAIQASRPSKGCGAPCELSTRHLQKSRSR